MFDVQGGWVALRCPRKRSDSRGRRPMRAATVEATAAHATRPQVGGSMNLTTQPARAGAALRVDSAMPKRSRLFAALIAVAVLLGLFGLSAEATAAGVRVGHKVEDTV